MTQAPHYRVPTDRLYEPQTHLWVQRRGDVVRVGMDELGQETTGDLAYLQLAAPGTRLERGDELGSIEAGKFVGAIASPISGTVSAINQTVLDNPRLVNVDPLEAGWLVEIVPAADETLANLVGEPEAIQRWFAQRVREYREKGILAE